MPLDENSPYYRICPLCRKPHMVHNKGRDYCSDKCYHDFYNQTRKLKKISTQYGQQFSETQKQLNNYQEHPKKELAPDAFEKNQNILSALRLDENGTLYKIQELENAGFEFYAYSYRYPLNTDLNIYGLEYGSYVAFLTEPDSLLIHHKK